jgi:hypothetical protein
VLKVVADTALTGDQSIDEYTHEPDGFNYWKREALAYGSGFAYGLARTSGTRALLQGR